MNILHYIYFFLLYGTIVCFISQLRQLNFTLGVLFVYLLLLAGVSTTGMLMQLNKLNNLYLFRLFTPVEYLLICLMYFPALEKRNIKKVLHWSVYGFFIVCGLITYFLESWLVVDSFARTIEALLVTIWILIYFKQKLSTSNELNLHADPMFWISMGFLIYFIGILFIHGLLNILIKQDRVLAQTLYRLTYFFEYNLFIEMNIALFCRQIFKVRTTR